MSEYEIHFVVSCFIWYKRFRSEIKSRHCRLFETKLNFMLFIVCWDHLGRKTITSWLDSLAFELARVTVVKAL